MLGAQVGETAILAAAGRHFACRSPGITFCEGSYGDLLLAADVAPFGIGAGGLGAAIEGVGLGIDVDPTRVAAHVTECVELEGGGRVRPG
jgi:muconate cycloisomerase